jgi:hypothetical protein
MNLISYVEGDSSGADKPKKDNRMKIIIILIIAILFSGCGNSDSEITEKLSQKYKNHFTSLGIKNIHTDHNGADYYYRINDSLTSSEFIVRSKACRSMKFSVATGTIFMSIDTKENISRHGRKYVFKTLDECFDKIVLSIREQKQAKESSQKSLENKKSEPLD